MSSEGALQRRFMEARGNEKVEVEESGSGGSGWRVREEEVVEGEGGDGNNDANSSSRKRSRRRRRVEIRTRSLSYVTPIGGSGRRESERGKVKVDEKASSSPSSFTAPQVSSV